MDVTFSISSLKFHSDDELLQMLKSKVLNKDVSFTSGDGFYREGVVNDVLILVAEPPKLFKTVVFCMDSGIGTVKYSVNVIRDIIVHNVSLNRIYSLSDPYGEEIWEE